jgi:uncharacterized membrane protein
VAGTALVGQSYRAYTWSDADGVRLYEPVADVDVADSHGLAINSQGTVVGISYFVRGDGQNVQAPTLWRPDGEAVVLPSWGDRPWAIANAINEAGVVAGLDGPPSAVVWPAYDQEPVWLEGAVGGRAWGINDRGDIVGVVNHFAMLWRDHVGTILHPLPGHAAATARDLTEPDAEGRIRVVGWSEAQHWGPQAERRPVIWIVDGTDIQVEELYPPAGHPGAIAKAITIHNGDVVVVGTSYTRDSAFAVMWSTSRDACGP